jgi:hypothetical protein
MAGVTWNQCTDGRAIATDRHLVLNVAPVSGGWFRYVVWAATQRPGDFVAWGESATMERAQESALRAARRG